MCVIVKKVAKNVKGWKCLKMGRGDFFEFEWGIRHIVGKHACALALSGRCRIGRQDGKYQYDPEVDRARARRPQTIRPLRMRHRRFGLRLSRLRDSFSPATLKTGGFPPVLF